MATVFQNREKIHHYLTSRVEGILGLKGLFGTFPLPFFKYGTAFKYIHLLQQ